MLAAITTFLAALLWAKNRDPFTRIDFTLRAADAGKTEGLVVLPKPAARFPVVVYLYGSGGSVLASGKILRQFAELGCAAVAIEYSQTNQLHLNEQLLALHQYLGRQEWAQTNAMAWVGLSLGAQRSLSFLLTHPEVQPQLYVRVAGGLVEELKEAKVEGRESKAEKSQSTINHQLSTLRFPVLLVHGEHDQIFPVADCRKLAESLAASGVNVKTHILPGQPHAFGGNAGTGGDLNVVMRAVAEACLAHLPLADYTAALRDCRLSDVEQERFNVAMSRAGQNRRALWNAITAFDEPERRTVMMLIGGLEDYDLAHISTEHLEEVIKVAWKARRTYPWCRDTPPVIFEKFTAGVRMSEEPLVRFHSYFRQWMVRHVKYCHTTAEASDAVAAWERTRTKFDPQPTGDQIPTPIEVFINNKGNCDLLIPLYAALARSVGLPARCVRVPWPTLGATHAYAEIWDTERNAWHAFDGAASPRRFHDNWMLNVPKSVTHTVTGERGVWNAAAENRWEVFTNTVGLFYPSGRVRVRVLEQETPKAGQRVNVQVWLKGRMIHLASDKTDSQGEVSFTLGQSARQPYRFVLERSDQNDWAWVAVQADKNYEVTLHADRTKPFDPSVTPPPLGFPQWDQLPQRK